MDVTLLYNGYNLQRRKMYPTIPRNNLISQIQIDWPNSLHHQQLSPLSKIKQRQSLQTKLIAQHHNSFIDQYLSKNLNINDSRIKRGKFISRVKGNERESLSKTSNLENISYVQSNNGEQISQNNLKLPKIYHEESIRSNNMISQLLKNKNKNGYLQNMLRSRLKKYQH